MEDSGRASQNLDWV